jgi:hypothetical protein
MKRASLRLLIPTFVFTIALGSGVAANAAGGVTAGRYQIVASPTGASHDTFLIDTANGSVWQLNTITALQNEPEVWEPMPRFDSAHQEADWLKTQTLKPK